MQFDGRRIDRYTGTTSIVRKNEETGDLEEIRIRVKQLPVTWEEECEMQLPKPKPPVVGRVYDKQGKDTPKYDTDDPEFLEAYREWEHRRWAKKIHDATIDDRVTWETSRDGKTHEEFYDGIFAELSDSFTRSEITSWITTINLIDQVGGADIAQAKESLHRWIIGNGEVSELGEIAGDLGENSADAVVP